MLSSVKNFFLTFILAVIIFGLVASSVLAICINNINSSLDSSVNPSETTDESGSQGSTSPEQRETEDHSKSLNILIIGSDYRSGVFADYDPDVLYSLYGIKDGKVKEEAPPYDVEAPSAEHASGIVSDKEDQNEEGIKISDTTLVFEGGFYSVDYRQIEADTIILIRYDKERSQITYTSFPTDAYIKVNGDYCRLSEIYGTYGAETVMDAVHSITGLTVDRYVVFTMDTFPDFIDALGGLDYTVPCRMKYDDYAGDVHINLYEGNQHLDGDAALELLMFNSYKDGYNTRIRTANSFMRSMILSMASPSTIIRLPSAFRQLSGSLTTDLKLTDITENITAAISCATNVAELPVVTKKQKVNDDANAVIYDMSGCYNAFSKYKKIYK